MNNTTPTPTILIVDDTPANLALLLDLLGTRGYRVLVAEDGISAIEQVQHLKPDLILLDVLMPGLNGFETCRLLKMSTGSHDIPIIFLTALSETINKVQGFEVGGVDYITKPIDEVEVLVRIKTHLTIRDLQSRLSKQNELLEQQVAERTQQLALANQELGVTNQQLALANQQLGSSNTKLSAEIAQRKQNEKEKDNLLSMLRQQSDQLSDLTSLLIEAQQKQRRGLAQGLHEQVEQNLKLVSSNLDFVHRILADHIPRPERVCGMPFECNTAKKTILNTQQILSRTQAYLQSVEVDSHTPEEKQLQESLLLKLSSREREVLRLLIDGKTHLQIANVLNISHKTVATYRHRIMTKLNLNDVAELVKFAIKHGLTDIG
jgi:DNA-binding response OmpR family regulator/DNA-binding CsgD family transcriptional regulator